MDSKIIGMSERGENIKLRHIFVAICLSVLAVATANAASQKDGLLKIYFLDVGQGDAIFIEAPNGNQVLIDGGPDNKILSELSGVVPFYDRELDTILATHPHADHITGLIEVLERYDVANVVQAKEGYVSPVFERWQRAVKEEETNEVEAIAGKVIDLGNEVTLTVMTPFKSYDGVVLKNPHEANVTTLLQYGSFRALLTGDMEAPLERQLLLRGRDVSADILKVGHHGSKTSSTEVFLSAVEPEVAFIEVGSGNQYGLPAQEVTSRLEKFGIKYYRTDLDGTVKVISDGESYQIITQQ